MARIISFFSSLIRRQSRSVVEFSKPENTDIETVPAKVEVEASSTPGSSQFMVNKLVVEKIRLSVDEMVEQSRINAKQAFVIDQLVTTLEELSLMGQNITRDVGKVLELAEHSEMSAKDGGHAAAQVVDTIDRVRGSNDEISRVTHDVELIARESKILSYNSMAEAARAGAQGATFMVVAKRIQDLATHAAESAVKINKVTTSANQYVKESQDAAESCNLGLSSIIGKSGEVRELIARLNSSLRSQSEMLTELNRVVTGVRDDIQVVSMKLERGIMTMPELLEAIDRPNSEHAPSYSSADATTHLKSGNSDLDEF